MKIMKKLMVAVIAMFIGTTAFSQSIDFGIKAGANFASISDVAGTSNKTGFHAGAFAAIKYSKIGIQADLLYSQQGTKFKFGDFDLDYVNVPVVVKYYLIQGLNVQLGPQFGFLVNDSVPSGSDMNSMDVSGVAGLGLDLPLGIRLDARYNFGLTDVSKVSGAKGKNNVFALAVGYSFL